jgi:hypothetical protein
MGVRGRSIPANLFSVSVGQRDRPEEGQNPGQRCIFRLLRLNSVRFFADVQSSFALSELSRGELEALPVRLFGEVAALQQIVSEQREEIARLKGLKGPPDIRPSGMNKATEPATPGAQKDRPRRGKVRPRVSIEEHVLKTTAPVGSRFKGYETYLLQELALSVRALRYMRERWVTPGRADHRRRVAGGDPRTFRPRPAPFRADAVSSGADHIAAPDGVTAFSRRVDLQARGSTAVD